MSGKRSLTIKLDVPEDQLQISIDNAVNQAMSATIQRKIDERIDYIVALKLERIEKQIKERIEKEVTDRVRAYGYVEGIVRAKAGELLINRMPQLAEPTE